MSDLLQHPATIAIIGMAGKFPGAPDIHTFWQNLIAGKDTITRFNPADSTAVGVNSPDFVAARGVLEDAGLFDADFFGIVPREAARMDPQHRLFLEACSNALEDAGYVSQNYPGEIGLFAGCALNTYLLANLCKDRAFIDEFTSNYQVGEFQTLTGNDKDFLTTRVAYKLDLRGPVVTVQSACATSLVAICQAAQSLLNFQCDMALAGGASITFPQLRGHIPQEGGLASTDGVCRPFDANAAGTVFGHGVGVILLKRLEDAVRDGDHIAAVIRGFAVNNDGAQKAGYMAPGVNGQARVISAAQAMAGVTADTISYVEAHGTGTPLGDPIEFAALTQAFRETTDRAGFCTLGTAKGNVGHLDAAAGVTGVIKTVLSLQNKTLPGLAHFHAPNPELSLSDSPFVITAENKPWEVNGPRRAGVSAFGVGGVNAHIVIEEAPLLPLAKTAQAEFPIFLSARTDKALQTAIANIASYLEANPAANLADVAFTLATGRRAFSHRFAFAANSTASVVTQLREAAERTSFEQSSDARVAFLFSGQGAQFISMGKALYDSQPAYRDAFDECAAIAQSEFDFDLHPLIFTESNEANAARLQETRYAQPALFATEFALAKLWQGWGILPEAMAGHSLGEYVVAVLCGVMSVRDAMQLVCLRGKLMQQMESGAMLSVPLGEEALAKYLTPEISIAALNSPRASVLSGPIAAIASLEKTFAQDGIAARRLRTSHAFHSVMMDPMLAEFEREVSSIALHKPANQFVSTVTGTWITDEQATSPAYWTQQVRKPVRFTDAIKTLRKSGINLFLEVGPGETLTALSLQQRAKDELFRAIASMPMPRESAPAASIQITLANLWAAGVTPDWNKIFPAESSRRVPLPTYPFEHTLHWIEPPVSQISATTSTEQISQETRTMTSSPTPTAPTTTDSPSRLARLQTEIAAVFSDLSGILLSLADYDLSFLQLGFDSLFLTQATLSLQRAFGVKITFRQLMERFSSVTALAGHLDAILPVDAFAPAPAAPSTETLAATSPLPQLPASTGNGTALEALFAQQLATLTSVFTAQMAALQSTASTVTPTPAIASPTMPVVAKQPAVISVAATHGTFQPASRSSHELDPEQQKYLAGLIALTEARTAGSKALTESGRAKLADPRAVAGFRPQWKEMVYPLITDRAQGSRLWDVDGNEYIDIVNGFGCILFGHSPQFVVEAAHKQLDIGVAIGPQSPLAIEVAELICELTGNERATFCNTGSEAVMAAIRVARTVTGRDKFVYFTGDYHGTFDEVLIRNTPRGSAPLAPGIPTRNTSNVVVLDYGTDASLEYIRAHADEIAAVLIEPVQTRHPDNKPFDFIRAIREITAQTGVVMILDEVVTGFRLAPGGMQELLGIRADMCTYGKVIGGGHPIGVLSGKAEYLDALDGGEWHFGDDSAPEVGVTFFAGTFVRHPLAMAAARAVLLHLKNEGPALQQSLNRRTAELAERLDNFFVERGVPARIHHFASWFYWTFPTDAKLATLFYYAMRVKGIHIQEGYPCFLTTAHTNADFKAIEQAFRETIIEMQAAKAMPCILEGVSVETSPAQVLREPAMHELSLRNTPERVALTEPQREIFLAAALSDEANCAFNESLTVTLRGPVREADLRFALEAVISRHDALRSVVCEDGDCLCVDPVFSGEATLIDLRNETVERQQQLLAENIAYEGRTPFDLHHGPLVRSTCFLNSDQELVLLLTAHHIVLDGWSANQLLEEISVVYSKGASALTELAPLLPFSSYATRQIERGKAGEFVANENFWVSKFAGRSPRLELPTDRLRPTTKSYRGATLTGSLNHSLYEDLKKLSAKNGCSLYVELLSSFQLLLHRLTRQDEVVVGISTAGQSLIEAASLVGHCVNFLPMLSELTPATTVVEHLHATRSALLDAQDHQEFTYGSLLQKLTLEREPGRLPLIEVQFNLERIGTNVRFVGLESEIRPNPRQFVNTDLFLNVVESPAGLEFTCDYNTDLFDASTLERWMSHWSELLRGEVVNSTAKVSDLTLLTSSEQSHILNDWNQTTVDFGSFASLPSAVLKHAAQTPGRVAIECAGRQWTYAELAEYATILARRLVHEGLEPGALVGICIERSLEMAGALLAVMMAGGAYVPLDPRHPRERLSTIIADSGIKLLLTGRDPSIDTSVKMLNITGPQPQHSSILPQTIAASDLAYIIYTSGSTGKPKGVAIEHAALMNLLHSMQREPGLNSDDVFVAVTTLAFDIAALELFLPMFTGAKLVIATDEQITNGALLLHLLEDSHATILQATPGVWRILLDAGWSDSQPLKVLCGGEALPRDLADKLLSRSSDVWNVYGPTETTIWSSANRVTAGKTPLRIGPAIANTQFYILDSEQRLAPIGVAGELCIGGDGLARGYWNRPELTAEKFLADPFGPGRIYRTGDLGRWHADGTIELLGRTDFQVKIRGYRIELGEIESAFGAHPQVREAIVLAHQLSGSVTAQLIAFVDTGDFSINSAQLVTALREMLERALPTYMVPQNILLLNELPRLPNTKVDRKMLLRLAAEQTLNAPSRRAYTPPANDEERRMASIWSDILQLNQVSTTDSIFELGADSLAVFRIAARAQREGLPIKPAQIFEHRNIAAICAALSAVTQAPQPAAESSSKRPAKRITVASRESYKLTR